MARRWPGDLWPHLDIEPRWGISGQVNGELPQCAVVVSGLAIR